VGRYLVKRLIQAPVVLWILVTITFFMVRLAPGGPFSGEKQVDPVILERMQEKYGLDDPLPLQYLRFLGNLCLLDLGPSYKNKTQTVNEIIATKAPVSAFLGALSVLLALLLGIGAGVIGGIRQNTFWDHSSMAVAMIGLSVPTFVVGPILALVFGIYLDWVRSSGYEGLSEPSLLIMPTITLALPFAARIARLARAGMLDVINQDYIRTAWAKGLREWVIVLRHALRGALLPVVSFLGPAIAALFTGSLVVETVFAIPGLGRDFVQSALNRDYTLVMGTVILYGVLIVLLNLVVDIAYGFLDPRIRHA